MTCSNAWGWPLTNVTVNWYGDKVVSHINDSLKKRLYRAGAHLSNSISTSFQRTPKLMGKRGKRRRAGPGQQLYVPSKPGETPAIQTATLKRSIGHAEEGFVSRVGPRKPLGGVGLKYARMLEFGTRRMRARPFMRPAVHRERSTIGLILAGKR